jgi:hypothetical protein
LIAASIRSEVDAGNLIPALRYRDTVDGETPAADATSLRLASNFVFATLTSTKALY